MGMIILYPYIRGAFGYTVAYLPSGMVGRYDVYVGPLKVSA